MAVLIFFCFKQRTAYEMRISDWSSDVCSSYLSCKQRLLHVSDAYNGPGEVVNVSSRPPDTTVAHPARRMVSDTTRRGTCEDSGDGPERAPRRRHLRAVPLPLLTRQPRSRGRRHPGGRGHLPGAALAGGHPSGRGHGPRQRVVPPTPVCCPQETHGHGPPP